MERGEVHFKLGMRWMLWLLALFLGGVLFFLPGIGFLWLHESLAQVIVGGLLAISGGYGLVFPFFAILNPKVHRNHRMRVSRDGIEMAGVRIPWHAIDEIDIFAEGYGHARTNHTVVLLSQAISHDGSQDGQRLAAQANQGGRILLFTGRMNVWAFTLRDFLKWVKLECTPNATDLCFESM